MYVCVRFPVVMPSAASALQHVWAHMCEIELESAGVGDGAGFQWQTFPAATARAGAARASDSVAGEVLEANMSAEYNPVTVVPQGLRCAKVNRSPSLLSC